MSLSAMIRKFQPGNLATATVTTVATVHPKTLSSVAAVAGVAVANAKIVKREGREFRSRAPRPKVVTVLPKSEISGNPLFKAELVHNTDPDTQHRLENQHLSLPGRSEGYCSGYNINLSAMIRKCQYGNLATATVATFATAPTNTPPTDSTATAAMAKVVTAYSSEFQSLAPCPGGSNSAAKNGEISKSAFFISGKFRISP